MKTKDKIVFFENQKVRNIEHNGEMFFSVVDIVAILTQSKNSRRYWSDLKIKLSEQEGFVQLYDKIVQLKLLSSDGKKYKTDCANLQNCFRIIQSIPSPKAEPFKQWLAKVGAERIEEIENPEIAQERMMEIYRQKGYDEAWIKQRIQSIRTRKNLTDEWDLRGAVKSDYGVFTAIMSQATFGLKPSEHKDIKGLKRENLRDHMTDVELALTNLGEVTAREIHKTNNTFGKDNLRKDVAKAGKIAGNARLQIEEETGKKVISSENYLTLNRKGKLGNDKTK